MYAPLGREPEDEHANRAGDDAVPQPLFVGAAGEVFGEEPERAELEERSSERHAPVDDEVLARRLIADLGGVEGHEGEEGHAGDEQPNRLPVGHHV
jgi:hypothetical protein